MYYQYFNVILILHKENDIIMAVEIRLNGYRTKGLIMLYLFTAIQLIFASWVNIGLAKNEVYQIFPSESKPYGHDYAEWVDKWWQWISAVPHDRNPLMDPTGKFCGEGQSDPNVFFLAGTLGGKAERICTISSDKALFFPVLNIKSNIIRTAEFESIEDIKKFVNENQDAVALISAHINNISIVNLPTLRTQSQFFNLTYPENNAQGIEPDHTIAVSNGTWIMLKPLPPGYHIINFKGVLADSTRIDQVDTIMDITYHINVYPSG